MEELKDAFSKLSESMSEMNDIMIVIDKCGNKNIEMDLVKLRMEKGILESLQNASLKQLEHLERSYHFKFHDEETVKLKIKQEIRNKKMRSIK